MLPSWSRQRAMVEPTVVMSVTWPSMQKPVCERRCVPARYAAPRPHTPTRAPTSTPKAGGNVHPGAAGLVVAAAAAGSKLAATSTPALLASSLLLPFGHDQACIDAGGDE